MAKYTYSFYPGCSSEKKASASNMMTSVETMCSKLDIQLNEIPDWNCCSASIGYCGGGELPRLAMNARNIALSEQHNPEQDIVATCAACWLGTRECQERIRQSETILTDTLEVLKEAGLEANLGLEGVLTNGADHLEGDIWAIEETCVIRRGALVTHGVVVLGSSALGVRRTTEWIDEDLNTTVDSTNSEVTSVIDSTDGRTTSA